MSHCYCDVHNKSPVIGQCFLVALSCVAVRCKCIYTNDMAAVLHMMEVVVIPCKPGDQKVSVHLMITIQKAGAQMLFDHPV